MHRFVWLKRAEVTSPSPRLPPAASWAPDLGIVRCGLNVRRSWASDVAGWNLAADGAGAGGPGADLVVGAGGRVLAVRVPWSGAGGRVLVVGVRVVQVLVVRTQVGGVSRRRRGLGTPDSSSPRVAPATAGKKNEGVLGCSQNSCCFGSLPDLRYAVVGATEHAN